MKNKLVLAIGAVLIGFGLFGRYLPIDTLKPTVPAVDSYVVDAPSDEALLENIVTLSYGSSIEI